MKELKNLFDSYEAKIGTSEAKKAILRSNVKAIIYSQDLDFSLPKDIKAIKYPGSSHDLGKACNRPYPIKVIAFVAKK